MLKQASTPTEASMIAALKAPSFSAKTRASLDRSW
jgi:hypothetical protein